MNDMPKLSIVTVTYKNLSGLKRTIDSIFSLQRDNLEYWVIDNCSSDGTREFLSAPAQAWIHWIRESDDGLYDAMNKSLPRLSGDYALFINGGDSLLPNFSWSQFISTDSVSTAVRAEKVLIGRTIERFGQDRYLRPGIGKENAFLSVVPHQATFYPRAFFQNNRYRLDLPIGADGEYTRTAINERGVLFVPQTVCEFELGGLSSSYGSMRVFKLRWDEQETVSGRLRLLFKLILWNLLPRAIFYRLLATGKYTKLVSEGIDGEIELIASFKGK